MTPSRTQAGDRFAENKDWLVGCIAHIEVDGVTVYVKPLNSTFVLCMVLAIVLLCLFPQIALWLPEALMGPGF